MIIDSALVNIQKKKREFERAIRRAMNNFILLVYFLSQDRVKYKPLLLCCDCIHHMLDNTNRDGLEKRE